MEIFLIPAIRQSGCSRFGRFDAKLSGVKACVAAMFPPLRKPNRFVYPAGIMQDLFLFVSDIFGKFQQPRRKPAWDSSRNSKQVFGKEMVASGSQLPRLQATCMDFHSHLHDHLRLLLGCLQSRFSSSNGLQVDSPKPASKTPVRKCGEFQSIVVWNFLSSSLHSFCTNPRPNMTPFGRPPPGCTHCPHR